MKILSAALFLAAIAAAAQQPNLAGKWTTNIDTFGTPTNWNLTIVQKGGQISGELGGDKVEGTFKDGKLQFHASDPQGGYEDVTATVSGNRIMGSLVWAQNASVTHPTTHTFTATRVVPAGGPTAPPRTHEFTPTVFRRQFSSAYEPVLTVNSGDTIHTWTVDAGGYDSTGTPKSLGGNPQTGPFLINGAAPGDVLAIHIRRLKLNRDWAISTNGIVDRANPPGIAGRLGDKAGQVRWHLDLEKGLASPEKPGPHMAHYSVPVKPMLGCVAVATDPSGPAPRTGDSGNFGGNMDFNEVTEGATLYLPVRVPGALLYFGDGHAVQGDGETTGDALETSMDVTVTVEVVHDVPVRGPFLETPTHLMAIGLDGSIDAAFQDATERMENYLARAYKLTPTEFAMVLGTAAEYKVSEAADRNAGVVLKMAKSKLDTLTRPASPGQPDPSTPTIAR
ncbi:acetamidase/formamidase family protein [Terriglobus roseus]|uniref:Acetamidase/formamidase n=1 Tax=Terriglobus roseus TaxID=392734 RepID=A0A1H4U300_9BACT|nr:acetamidase/formamidase family protein [Terriglobus roseus]SEC63105.1 Acetamidase/formamidase [Terriglobus roseus]